MILAERFEGIANYFKKGQRNGITVENGESHE